MYQQRKGDGFDLDGRPAFLRCGGKDNRYSVQLLSPTRMVKLTSRRPKSWPMLRQTARPYNLLPTWAFSRTERVFRSAWSSAWLKLASPTGPTSSPWLVA